MAGVPCTLIIDIVDDIDFPLPMALVVIKTIFKFGVKYITYRAGKILVALSYSPKKETLEKKFGNLPIKYSRVNITTDDEFTLFEHAIKKWSFDTGNETDPLSIATVSPINQTLPALQPAYILPTIEDDNIDESTLDLGASQQISQ